jgi:adenosine/AMP kinase
MKIHLLSYKLKFTGMVNMSGGVEFKVVKIHKPEDVNFILGQSHFIKTVEDISEAVVGAVPGAKFGLAFSESSGECLIRMAMMRI